MLIGAILGGILALILHFFGFQDNIIHFFNLADLGTIVNILYYVAFVFIGGLIGYLIDR